MRCFRCRNLLRFCWAGYEHQHCCNCYCCCRYTISRIAPQCIQDIPRLSELNHLRYPSLEFTHFGHWTSMDIPSPGSVIHRRGWLQILGIVSRPRLGLQRCTGDDPSDDCDMAIGNWDWGIPQCLQNIP